VLAAAPPTIRTSAPGSSASGPATVRWASEMLSLALAIAAGDTPSGAGRSMASAKGTRTRSASAPPHSPPAGPIPYIEPRGRTSRQLPVQPRRHASQAPQEIWKGTTATSPADHLSTPSPTSTTSATNSCPSASGPWNGEAPVTIAASRSHVATASGRTSACAGPSTAGSATSRHWTLTGSMKVSSRISDRDEVLADGREDLRPVVGHHDEVLDPHPEASGQVDARFDGDDVPRLKRRLVALGQPRRLVDLEAHAVAEPVAELIAAPGLLDRPARGGVHLAAAGPRAHGV